MTEEQRPDFPINFPDRNELATAWCALLFNTLESFFTFARRAANVPAPLPFDPLAPAWAVIELAAAMSSNPLQALPSHDAFDEWAKFWQHTVSGASGSQREVLIAPERGDRRFNHPAWNEISYFDTLKQSYLLASRQALGLIESLDIDPELRARVEFYARQYLNAISPANFALTNPEALIQAGQTGGVSLLSGLANMIADAGSPSGLVKRRSDESFEMGVNIASTPGSIVFQNELMQLIQYAPTTAKVYRRPLLYVPPLVNKYYLLDLQEKSSMIRWLVEQGHTVFVISWINPGAELRAKSMSDYIFEGPLAALEKIEAITGERSVDGFGFCMGGTLLAIAAGYLEAAGNADRLGSLTVIGTLLDFSHSGEWAAFYEPAQKQALARHLAVEGVIAADKLQALFSVVRANDLIWAPVVNHYLLDRKAPPSDLLYWFADGARIPEAFLIEYGKMLSDNALMSPGSVTIGGLAIDLGAITIPVAVVALKDDHVSAWEGTYQGARLFGGATTFILGGSGHNAGLVNPPSAKRHGYWTNPQMPESPEEWMREAQPHEGSWWSNWQQWLSHKQSDEKVPKRVPGAGGTSILEAAPGSYARSK